MEVKIRKQEGVYTVLFSGEINFNDVVRCNGHLENGKGFKEIRIDLREVTFVTSSFFGIIFTFQKKYQDVKFKILDPNPHILDLIRTAHISDIIDVVMTGESKE